MPSRLVVALLIALLAHAGAYAIILVTSPEKKADIQIQGGSISISLKPTASPASEDPDASDESLPEPETDAPVESAPAEHVPEPMIEPVIEPEPKSPFEPETTPEPIPEPAEMLPEPEPDVELESSREAEPKSEPELTPSTEASHHDNQPTEAPPATNAEQDSDLASESSTAENDAPGDQISSAETAKAKIGNAAQDNYNGALMRHMRKARKFDTNARRSSKIAITIDPQGHVLEIKVLRASGDKTWDRRVIKELKRIAPYPAPPSGASHSWTFDAVPK
ncbi:MAG: TonB family protein [Pseudomonadota bacterium]